MKALFIVLFTVLLSIIVHAKNNKQTTLKKLKIVKITYKDLFDKIIIIDSEIEIIKVFLGITTTDEDVSKMIRHTNINVESKHIWQMIYLLNIKTNQFRIKNNLARIEEAGIAPKTNIDTNLLYGMLERLHTELLIIKKQFNIKKQVKNTVIHTLKHKIISANLIFNELVHISTEFDLLNNEIIKPSNVFAQVMRVHSDINLILDKLNIYDKTTVPNKNKNSKPHHAFKNAMFLMDKVQVLKRYYGGASINFDELYKNNIKPEDVFILTSLINAELQFIKNKIGLKNNITTPAIVYTNKVPSDVEQLLAWNIKRLMLVIQNQDKTYVK